MNKEQDKQDKIIEEEDVGRLREKCDEYLNGWKRAQADYQNLVKEFNQSKKEYVKFANENLIMDLLPILDNFKAAFSQVPAQEKDSPWVIGFNHIRKQFEELLWANGVEEIKTVGEKFNHCLHEAVEHRDSDGEEGIILAEARPGYTLNKKVVQAAKVVVSNNKSKN